MKAAITGGAGRQCLATIYSFIESHDVEKVLLIDIDDEALRRRKEKVNSQKVETKLVDITDINALAEVLSDCDVVLNASSHVFNMNVMDACLISKTCYTDFGGLFHWAREQLTRHEDFKRAGITGIVGSGSAPGIVNVFAKYAVDQLDTVDTVLILDAIINPTAAGFKFVPPYALNTILEEFTANNYEFRNGEFVELPPFSGEISVDFPEPYGKLKLYNMIHSEVATMPIAFKEKGIRNVAFKLSLPTVFVERLRFLIENNMGSKEKINVKGVEITPRDFILELFETKPSDIKPACIEPASDRKLLRVVVTGTKGGRNLTYEVETDLNLHPWGLPNNQFTVGFPGAITARMLGNGWIKEKGFFTGESIIDPMVYFSELKKKGIVVKVKRIEEI